jgi:hypothetical protein
MVVSDDLVRPKVSHKLPAGAARSTGNMFRVRHPRRLPIEGNHTAGETDTLPGG